MVNAQRRRRPGTVAQSGRELTGSLLLLLSGLAALGSLSTNIILPSFPSISAALAIAPADLGLTLSAFFIAFAIGQLFVGPLSDRYGRKWLVLGGLCIFAGGSAICATAPDLPTLVAGRVVQALGICAASVLSRAIARDLFDGEPLGKALALTMVATAAAPGFSPLLGGLLDQALGWRSSFVLTAILAALLALFYAAGTGETHPASRRTATSLVSIGRAYAGLIADPRFIRPAAAVSLVIGALYAMFAATPAILMGDLGFSPLQLGLFFAATVVVVFAGGLMAPRLAHRWGQRRMALAGMFIAVLGGAALLAVAIAGLSNFPLFAAAVTIFLFGMGLANPLGTAITLHPFGASAGLASALLGFLQMAFAAIGTTIVTKLGLDPQVSLGLVLAGAALMATAIFATQTERRA